MYTQKERVNRSSRLNRQETTMAAEITEYYHLASYSQMVRFLIHKAYQEIKKADKAVK